MEQALPRFQHGLKTGTNISKSVGQFQAAVNTNVLICKAFETWEGCSACRGNHLPRDARHEHELLGMPTLAQKVHPCLANCQPFPTLQSQNQSPGLPFKLDKFIALNLSGSITTFPLSPTNFELQLISRKGHFQEDVERAGGLIHLAKPRHTNDHLEKWHNGYKQISEQARPRFKQQMFLF